MSSFFRTRPLCIFVPDTYLVLTKSIINSRRLFASTSSRMAKFSIDSKVKLNSGYEIPILGFGVYQTPAEEASDAVLHAMKTGYRHVDSAIVYRNEQPSVDGMNRSKIPRDQLFFTTKINVKAINYDGAKAAVDKSLKDTGLDYIDLILLHAPFGGPEGRLGGWKALVEAVEAGKVRSIGVSNYGIHHLEELETWQKEQPEGKGGVLSVNQIELHPWLARPDIVEWCQKRGVVVEAYSPLVQATRMDDKLLQGPVIKHQRTPAQILLRWGLQKGFVILPKSVTPKRIEENAQLFDFELDEDDMRDLHTIAYDPVCWDPTVCDLTE